jgi:sterol desaturase/sphingolipid hydroxylase (fatty acid hydroxylase superfamily)
MTEALQSAGGWLRHAAVDLLSATAHPDTRVSAPYLLGALLIGVVLWAVRARSGSLAAFLFPRAVWLHRSALLDYRLLVVRWALDLLVLGSLSLSATAIGISIARLLWHNVGILPRWELAGWVIAASFSVAAFIAEDFARYWLHRLCHRVPALWELHKLHHSAEVLTPFTIYRTHPLEGLLMSSGSTLAISFVAGVFMWLFPGQLRAWEVMGVFALSFAWSALGANLRHSHVWLSYGRKLEHVLISPAQHQIHHSTAAQHRDRNFGAALSLWDLAFGTLYTTSGREPLQFGLAPSELNHRGSVVSALLDPMRAALRRLAVRA